MKEKKQRLKPHVHRIDAGWDNARFLAEAETELQGELVYVAVTMHRKARSYRLLRESEYDTVFCRTDGVQLSPEAELRRFLNLRAAAAEETEYLSCLAVLDNIVDDAESLLEYHWQPGGEIDDPYGAEGLAEEEEY